jgi:hypothetical protein
MERRSIAGIEGIAVVLILSVALSLGSCSGGGGGGGGAPPPVTLNHLLSGDYQLQSLEYQAEPTNQILVQVQNITANGAGLITDPAGGIT